MQYWHGPSPIPFPEVIPNPDVHLGVVTIATKQILVVVLAVVLMVVLRAFVYRTKTGQSDARDGPGPRRRAVDGHRHQHHDRADVFDRFGLAGAAGFVSGVYYGSTWFFNGFGAA